jgi:solute:Na+ symporter, SSS family
MTPYVALLGLFVAVQIGVGVWVGRRVRGTLDFFVAGRRLSTRLIFATFLAANVGAGSTVGAASLGYSIGLSAWWWNASAGLGSLVLAAWAGPRLWRLASDHGFLTLGDFLEWRYGRAVRGIATSVLWVATLWILAAQLIGASSILQAVAGLPRWAGAGVGGLVMVVYFVAGGLLSSAWVNIVQLTVLLSGFAVALPLALHGVGGWSGLEAAEAGAPSSRFALMGPDWWWLTTAATLVPSFIVSPGLVQKAYGASSEHAVRVGVAANGVALLIFALFPAVLGMIAHGLHPALPSADLALPTLLARDLPPLVGAVALAAVFAAEVSSADAVLFMLATSLSQDLYRRFIAPTSADGRVLLVARGAAVVGGVAGIAIALVMPTVVNSLLVFYSLLTVLLFVPVVAGLAVPGAGSREALASMSAGGVTLVGIHLATAGAGVWGWKPATAGLVAAALAFLLAAATRRVR